MATQDPWVERCHETNVSFFHLVDSSYQDGGLLSGTTMGTFSFNVAEVQAAVSGRPGAPGRSNFTTQVTCSHCGEAIPLRVTQRTVLPTTASDLGRFRLWLNLVSRNWPWVALTALLIGAFAGGLAGLLNSPGSELSRDTLMGLVPEVLGGIAVVGLTGRTTRVSSCSAGRRAGTRFARLCSDW